MKVAWNLTVYILLFYEELQKQTWLICSLIFLIILFAKLVIYPSFISGLINFWQPIPDIYPPKGRLSEYRLYQGVSTQNWWALCKPHRKYINLHEMNHECSNPITISPFRADTSVDIFKDPLLERNPDKFKRKVMDLWQHPFP